MGDALVIVVVALLGVVIGVLAAVLIVRKVGKGAPERVRTSSIAERVRSVGRLVGLESQAKEIATSTKGWAWVPPILLSQARAAMIFHFEKQYAVDLARVGADDVVEVSPSRYRLTLPGIEGSLRLLEVEPYDIQAGRILGLLDVIQMNAETQKKLMDVAQQEASKVYTRNEERYLAEARRSIERQLTAMLSLFGVEIEIAWHDDKTATAEAPEREPGLVLAET